MKEFLRETSPNINLDKNICVHNFDHAMKSKKFLERFNEIKHRWESFGLLSGRTKDECAYCYEQLAVYFLTREEESEKNEVEERYGYGSFVTIAFPMIRRIVSALEPGKFNFDVFLKYVKEFNYNDLIEFIDKANPVVGPGPYYRLVEIDLEAEVLLLLCKMIVDKFNNPELDTKQIKERYMSKVDRKIKEALKKK